jgi:hypothetical protein
LSGADFAAFVDFINHMGRFLHNSQSHGGCAFLLRKYENYEKMISSSRIFYYVSSYVGAEKSRFQSYPFFSQHARQGTAAFCIAL